MTPAQVQKLLHACRQIYYHTNEACTRVCCCEGVVIGEIDKLRVLFRDEEDIEGTRQTLERMP